LSFWGRLGVAGQVPLGPEQACLRADRSAGWFMSVIGKGRREARVGSAVSIPPPRAAHVHAGAKAGCGRASPYPAGHRGLLRRAAGVRSVG
jgi:hypothetical protein